MWYRFSTDVEQLLVGNVVLYSMQIGNRKTIQHLTGWPDVEARLLPQYFTHSVEEHYRAQEGVVFGGHVLVRGVVNSNQNVWGAHRLQLGNPVGYLPGNLYDSPQHAIEGFQQWGSGGKESALQELQNMLTDRPVLRHFVYRLDQIPLCTW
jgi:hypothetical protein